jgi:hypothetical protein
MRQEITLKTLPKKTAQEVFDYVARHLLTQNKRAVGEYLTVDGLRCAAGCLMSPREYRITMRYQTWWYLSQKKLVPKHHCNLIGRLQDIHDDVDVEEWPEHLTRLAREKRLSAKAVTDFEPS